MKMNLRERSTEIKFLVERELRELYTPCSLTDMVKRVGASRLPVMKHLESLLSTPEFADLSIVRLGGVDVIYRIVAKPETIRQTEVETNGREDGENRVDEPNVVGRSGEAGQVE